MVYKHISHEERCDIYTQRSVGRTVTEIGETLGRSPATISRELRRNQGQRGYRPGQAQQKSVERGLSSGQNQPRIETSLHDHVARLLRLNWSPQQVSGRLAREGLGLISHETIYQLVYADKRSGGDLHLHLRSQKKRRKRYGSGRTRRGQIPNRIDIERRPAVVDDRLRIGHWEGDLIIGKGHTQAIVSLVERKSRFTLLRRIQRKTAKETCVAIIEEMKRFPEMFQTLTLDNGLEFAAHEEITKEIGVSIYFATPYHSWERGSNENTNGLVRQYAPKQSCFELLEQDDVEEFAEALNNRPRRTLDYQTPKEVFNKALKRRGFALLT